MKTTKERLEEIRKTLQLNQKQFACYAGVSTRTMNSWMTEERKCPDHVVDLLERQTAADLELSKHDLPTPPMMRWAVISSMNGSETITFYGAKADALRDGQTAWDHLTREEQKRADHHAVVLLKAQYKVDSRYPFQQYEDADHNIDGDWYKTEKEWK